MLMPISRLTARQPCVDMMLTCDDTVGLIDWKQDDGPVSGAMYVVRSGMPRANHSATMSKSPCDRRGWLPFGIDARFLNLPYSITHVSTLLPSCPSGYALLNTSWNQPRCDAAA